MGRAPCCDKANVRRGPWSPEEDAKLKSHVEQHGTGGNWIALPQKIGLKRCGKSCRLRWLNYLRPDIKHGGYSEEEDSIICRLYTSIGSRWSVIAAQLPGRTDNDVKNYWNTRLKKKLFLGISGTPRKEHRHGRRRRRPVGSPKKEAVQVMEKGSSSTPAAEDGSWRDHPHRPHQLQVLQLVQNQEPPAATAGYPSAGQLPVGQLLGDDSLDDPTPLSSLADDGPLKSSTTPSPPGGDVSPGAGAWCLMPELEEMFCYDAVISLEGLHLDGFYGVDNMVISEGGRTTTSTSSESLSWEPGRRS